MCKSTRPARELCRAGRRLDGAWYLGRGPGRGIWWCKNASCGQNLTQSHVARALRAAVQTSEMNDVGVLVAQVEGKSPEKLVKD